MNQHFTKLRLLMWKNWILQIRAPKQTVAELVAPILFCSILVLIRTLNDSQDFESISFKPFKIEIPVLTKFPNSFAEIGWSPQNPMLQKIMDETIGALQGHIPVKQIAFPNLAALDKYLTNIMNKDRILAGIDFGNSLSTATNLKNEINIVIKFPGELRVAMIAGLKSFTLLDYSWKTNLIFPLYQTAGPRSHDMNTGAEPSYYFEGFLKLQKELSCSIINHLKNSSSKCGDLTLQMQRFPYPSWIRDDTLLQIEAYVGLIILLSFMYFCITTVKAITTEKEKQLKETMKIMGLSNWLHWTAWFIKALIMATITIIIIVIMLQAKWYRHTKMSILNYSNPFVLFIFLITYSCAIITFCFALSVFFKQSNFASAVAGIFWFISYFPYLMTQNLIGITSLTQKMFLGLFFNSAMGYGVQQILMFEGKGIGIQWNNIWTRASPDDDFTLGYAILMLIFDSLLFLIITAYVQEVFPGEYGVPKPWNFMFLKSTWVKDDNKVPIKDQETPEQDREFFEADPVGFHKGVEIKNLEKTFKDKKAVDGLSFNMYENQITVLLGHNGAGKTTTMSMLTGMLCPTRGTAIINGHDIRTNMEQVRYSLGLCPQHNVLFDELTVYEHLYFYGQMKGVRKSIIDDEIHKYVELLAIVPKLNSRSCTLSGGMKRKLAVAIALCANSKVVLLDEPTAGMDPTARRDLWNLLQTQKEGRTILLSTHFMDEADVLGDRIAIMARGKLQCFGTSFFLKKKYGTGYLLTIAKKKECEVEPITHLLQKHIPNVKIKENASSELTYSLNKEDVGFFHTTLHDLEKRSAALHIDSFGISLTTLEEVFMRVGGDFHEELCVDVSNSNLESEISNELGLEKSNNYLTVFKTYFPCYRQFYAMSLKRYWSHKRACILIVIHGLISMALVLLAVYIIKTSSNATNDLPKHPIHLDYYENSITIFEHDAGNKYAEKYEAILNNNEKIKIKHGNMNENVLLLSEEDLLKRRMNYIIGASFEKNSIIAWFNGLPFHSIPLSLQHVMNAILHQEISSNYSLQFYNDPLPFGHATAFARLIQVNAIGFQVSLNIGFGMAFLSAYYIIFYIQERTSKSKHLQFVSGVNILVFWISSFLIDLIVFIFIALGILFTFVVLQIDGYTSATELGCLLVMLMVYGLAILPLTYLISFLIETPSTGYTRMIMLNLFTGVAALLIVQITAQNGNEDLSDMLHWFFLLSPTYALCTAIRDINVMSSIIEQCSRLIEQCNTMNVAGNPNYCENFDCRSEDRCCNLTHDFYDWNFPGIGKNLFFLVLLSITCIVILLLIEYRCLEKISNKLIKSNRRIVPLPHEHDENVKMENKKIREASTEDIPQYNLALRNVIKYYNKFLAVNNICLGVQKFECFGLLGINGAGKTTLFKIMTGEIPLSSGDVWIAGLNLRTDIKEIRKLIGYCPQFDALLDNFTCRENMYIFCLLRGLDPLQSDIMSVKLAKKFDFYKYFHKKVKQLSFGNKRKVSMAVSLINSPTILFLDEPTTGMDPEARHYFWNEIRKIRNSGTCIIITSHSMEECEALCTRLTIMVNGTFVCLGSTQQLKHKYANGFNLIIKLSKDSTNEDLKVIDKFIRMQVHIVVLREVHQQLATFYLEDKRMRWSTLFGIMEAAKEKFIIEDYALEQSSLEQVFLGFTQRQHGDIFDPLNRHETEITHL